MSIEQPVQTTLHDYNNFAVTEQNTKDESIREKINRLSHEDQISYYRKWLKDRYSHDSLDENRRAAEVYAEKATVPVTINGVTHTPNAPFRKEVSAYKVISKPQAWFFIILAIVSLTVLILDFTFALSIFVAGVTIYYVLSLVLNFALTMKSVTSPMDIFIEDSIIDAIEDADWPRYTILCPLYQEEESAPQLVRAIKEIDYPSDKLQVLVQLEVHDVGTLEVLKQQDLPPFLEIVMLPPGTPRTKPRSCNYGLTKATGDYVVIYDAEDIPDPRQLKKAVLAFSQEGENLACVQAKLNFYNANQNRLTRWFTIEYATWYEMVMPSLQWAHLSIPLGGTSNHFLTKVLRELGGWDAFNVTEDCDLGMRLEYDNYYTAVLDSTTYEEANSDLANWINQRTRWIKGFMITYMVYMRNPFQFLRPSRWAEFLSLQLIIGGRTLVVLINPILWLLMLVYIFFRPYVEAEYSQIFSPPIFYMGIGSLIFGNLFYIYTHILGAVRIKHFDLVRWAAIMPIYWIFHSVAGYKALYNFIFRPHYWEKTQHGLHQSEAETDVHTTSTIEGENQTFSSRLFDDIELAKRERYRSVSNEKTNIRLQVGWLKRLFSDRIMVSIGIGAVIVAFASLWFVFNQNLTVALSEAGLNLYIARRLFDSPTPGLGQLNYAHLPLYHLLMAPLALDDYLFTTGLAGSIISTVSYVVAVVYLYLVVKAITHNRQVSVIGTLIFALNPNILFLQAVPMGVMLSIATILASLYYLFKWIENDNPRTMILLAFSIFLATSSGYAGWLLFFGVLVTIASVGEKRDYTSMQTQSNLIVYSLLGSTGIILWIVWNWIILGIVGIPFSATQLPAEQLIFANETLLPGSKNFFGAFSILFYSGVNITGYVLLATTVIGLIYAVIKYRKKDIFWAVLLGAIPIVYIIGALVSGKLVIYVPEIAPIDAPTNILNMDVVSLLMIPIAIFSAVAINEFYRLFESMSWLRTGLATFGVFLIVWQGIWWSVNDNVIAFNESKIDFSANTAPAIIPYLANNYTGGLVLMSTPDEMAYPLATIADIPYKNLIHEGVGPQWDNAIAGYTQPQWVIVSPNSEDDAIVQILNEVDPNFLANYSLILEDDESNLLYHRNSFGQSNTGQ